MHNLYDYREIIGDRVISEINRLARPLYGLKVLHINSTYYGGGVAEMLNSLIPLLNDVGIDVDWRILRGTPDFFTITKKFHNAVQGEEINLTDIKKRLYQQANEDFASYCKIDHDVVFIHDPQPLPLIKYYKKKQPWVWRCHVDLSHPDQELWEYLKGYILRYDSVIVSEERYRKEDLPVEHHIIHPAIDPLASKNMEIPASLIAKNLKKFGVPSDKPIVTQISRFDKWKDPLGVIEVFKRVREKVNARLVLCGSMAADDPEGWQIFELVRRRANALIEKKDVILLTVENNILVNALQRSSAVIIQKSTREGFGLTVAEGLWKQRPVVASNVGGIPLQIVDGETGYLLDPDDHDGIAARIVELLENKDLARTMGAKAKEFVRERFLITRHIMDDLRLLNHLVR